jgi:hypothetical protein
MDALGNVDILLCCRNPSPASAERFSSHHAGLGAHASGGRPLYGRVRNSRSVCFNDAFASMVGRRDASAICDLRFSGEPQARHRRRAVIAIADELVVSYAAPCSSASNRMVGSLLRRGRQLATRPTPHSSRRGTRPRPLEVMSEIVAKRLVRHLEHAGLRGDEEAANRRRGSARTRIRGLTASRRHSGSRATPPMRPATVRSSESMPANLVLRAWCPRQSTRLCTRKSRLQTAPCYRPMAAILDSR